MSISVMTDVWKTSKHKGNKLLILLAIADFADDEGVAYPSVATLAKKARVSERCAQMMLRELEASGELTILQGEGPRGCNLYKINNLHRGANIAPSTPARLAGGGAKKYKRGCKKCPSGGATCCTRSVM